MQKVINAAARLVLRVRRREHMKRHLKYLRWLPITQRMDLRFMLIVASVSVKIVRFPLAG